MSYQLKYYYEFYSSQFNDLHRVEILQDTEDVLIAQEIEAQSSPFLVDMPQIKNVYDPIAGKGCTLNLISTSNFQLFNGLFHSNPKEFMIVHYITEVVNFLGYLNQEIYRENYQFTTNYGVTVSGNDGLALLSRYRFLDETKSKFTGLKSIWEIFKICIAKIGLPFVYIKVDMSTLMYQSDDTSGQLYPTTESSMMIETDTTLNYETGLTFGGDTIFHHSYLSCSNFYNESDEAMTMREVLEEILKPFSAFLRISGDTIYIQDTNSVAQAYVSYIRFDATTFEYDGVDYALAPININDVGYAGTGAGIEFRQGINRQKITYSPFLLKEIYKQIFSDIAEYNLPSSWYAAGFTNDQGVYLKSLPDHPLFIRTSGNFVQIRDENYCFFKWNKNDVASTLIVNKINPDVAFSSQALQAGRNSESGSVRLRISAKVLARTVSNPFLSELPEHIPYRGIRLMFMIKIGGVYDNHKYYDSNSARWSYTPAYTYIDIMNGDEDFTNKWIDVSADLWLHDEPRLLTGGLSASLFGGLEVRLMTPVKSFNKQGILIPFEELKDTWMKDFTIEIVDRNLNELINQDRQFEAILDEEFQESGDDVNLKVGTEINYNCNRGAIYREKDGKYLPAKIWKREFNQGNLEILLLSSLVSNNQKGIVTLTGLKLIRNFEVFNVLEDDVYLPNRKLIFAGGTFDYANDIVDCTLIESKTDEISVISGSTDATIGTLDIPETTRDGLINTGKPPIDRYFKEI